MIPFWTLGLVLACYLLGSIPSGLILARRMKGIDLRQHGSGNVGATNAWRALGLKGAVLVLAADGLKGWLAVHLALLALMPAFLLPIAKVVFGLAAVAGHNWSIFMGFKGGKGVATSLGVLLALSPQVAAMAALLWVAVVAMTRYSALGSLAAMVSVPLLMIAYGDEPVYIAFGLLAAAFALFRHRENLVRLRKGQELALGRRIEEEAEG